MNWSSFSDFAAMGGYGLYVWGSFGVTAAAMFLEVLSLRARRNALRSPQELPEPRVDYREATHEA